MTQESMINESDEDRPDSPEVEVVDTDATEPETEPERPEAAPVVQAQEQPRAQVVDEMINVLWKLADNICKTEFVPKAYRGKREQTFACMVQGRVLGIDPMTSLREIWISPNGSPEFSADLQAGLVRRHGHEIDGESSGDKCVMTGKRIGTDENGKRVVLESMTIEYTLDDAVKQGLVEIKDGKPFARSQEGKPKPWERAPQVMMWHRATTRLVQRLFPDVLIGESL